MQVKHEILGVNTRQTIKLDTFFVEKKSDWPPSLNLNLLNLIVWGGGLFTPFSKTLEIKCPFSRNDNIALIKQIYLNHDKSLKFQFKVWKKYFLTNKEVKTKTWCKMPPSNTIKEFVTPIVLGLNHVLFGNEY